MGNSVLHLGWKEIPKQAATRSGRWRLLAFGEMGEFGPRTPAGCPIADKPFVSVILTSMARRLRRLEVASLVHVFSYRRRKEESLRVGQACQCLQRAFQPRDVVGIEIDKDDLLTL